MAELLLSWPGYHSIKGLYFSEQPEMATHGHSTCTATMETPLRGLLSYRISSFSKREERMKKIQELFSVVRGVEDKTSLQSACKKPAFISGGGKSVLCHGKYLLSTVFLIQPSEFDPAF